VQSCQLVLRIILHPTTQILSKQNWNILNSTQPYEAWSKHRIQSVPPTDYCMIPEMTSVLCCKLHSRKYTNSCLITQHSTEEVQLSSTFSHRELFYSRYHRSPHHYDIDYRCSSIICWLFLGQLMSQFCTAPAQCVICCCFCSILVIQSLLVLDGQLWWAYTLTRQTSN